MDNEIVGAILADKDIFGYGDYESLPVRSQREPVPSSYANVVEILRVEDVEGLRREAVATATAIGANYFKTRVQALPEGITPEIMRATMTELGFVIGKYQGYGLRMPGTADLRPEVGPLTRSFIDALPFRVFRQQYAVAFDGWNTKYHIDHNDYRVHGFRCCVPLDDAAYIVFREGEANSLYVMRPGRAYFINIASTHRAFYFGPQERFNIMLQMDRDDAILAGTPCAPSSWDGIPDLYRDYNEISAIMGR